MFGLTPEKVLVLVLITALLLGPSRIQPAAELLGRFVRGVRKLADDTKARAREELGDEFDGIPWQKLDPRQYDPRRIIVEALHAPSAEPKNTSEGAAAPTGRAK